MILNKLRIKQHRGVVTLVKRLDKVLHRHAVQRNEVIHQGYFQEDQHRILEMYHLAESASRLDESFSQRGYRSLILEISREIIDGKKRAFMEFNVELAVLVRELFEALHPRYMKEENFLRLRAGKPAT